MNTWTLNNTLLNSQEITEKNQWGNQKILRNKWQWKHDKPKRMECSKRSSKREVYSNTILPQDTGKILNKQCNLHLKQLEKDKQKKLPKWAGRQNGGNNCWGAE